MLQNTNLPLCIMSLRVQKICSHHRKHKKGNKKWSRFPLVKTIRRLHDSYEHKIWEKVLKEHKLPMR
jgi:hypothetical protein